MSPRRKKPDPEEEPEDYIDPDAVRTVITFRGANNRPVPVPEDVVEKVDRIYSAHKRHLSGETWVAIARDMGYPSGGSLKVAVDRLLDEGRQLVEQQTGKQMLRDEIETLYYMQSKLWPQVEVGDPKAIDQVLRLVTKRVEWQNLALTEDTGSTVGSTVVVPGSTFTDYLQELAKKATTNPRQNQEAIEGQAVPLFTEVEDPDEEDT